jgi:hypothetical protein
MSIRCVPGGHDLVDPVQGLVVEFDVAAGEQVVELLRGPRPEDDRRDGRVYERKSLLSRHG